MSLFYENRTQTVRLENTERYFGLGCKLYAKAEYTNYGGSIKDRPAAAMIRELESRGVLKCGGYIAAATSGNMGIGIAMLAANRGYNALVTMPESASKERADIMRAYGAKIILTNSDRGMDGAINEAKRQLKLLNSGFYLDQFTNNVCIECHYSTTARELCEDIGIPDAFICGVGTGATIAGVGRYIKERKKETVTIAVEPSESRVLSGGTAGLHGIEGIGAGFVPELYKRYPADEVLTVSTEEAKDMTLFLARHEGILSGISTGANIAAAVKYARSVGKSGISIATVIADRGERYMSEGIFA